MGQGYSPSAATHRVIVVRPRERIGVGDVAAEFERAVREGRIEIWPYRPSVAPPVSPTPQGREAKLVDPQRIEVSGVVWRVARVQPGCELRVARDLSAAGYRTYCPLGRKFVGQARQRGVKRRGNAVRQFSVFAPYLFVGVPARLGFGKHSHDKIVAVIGDLSGPTRVEGRIIAAINARELAGQWYDTVAWREQTRLQPNSQVRIKGGPFADLTGIVEGLPAEMRVTVAVGLFGRPTRVEFDACQVERV